MSSLEHYKKLEVEIYNNIFISICCFQFCPRRIVIYNTTYLAETMNHSIAHLIGMADIRSHMRYALKKAAESLDQRFFIAKYKK